MLILLITLGGFFVVYVGFCWITLARLVTPQRLPAMLLSSEFSADIQTMTIRSGWDGIRLQAWWYPAPVLTPSSKQQSTPSRAIIIVHGIHHNGLNCHSLDLVKIYRAAGFAVCLFDLRAHGASEGKTVGIGVWEKHDIRAVVKFVRGQGIASGRIGIHGISYGAAVGLMATADIDDIGAIIADSSYADLQGLICGEIVRQAGLPKVLAQALIPGIGCLGRMIYRLDMRESSPVAIIRTIEPRPVLLIHGGRDERIPIGEAYQLKTAAGEHTELWVNPERGHEEGTMMGENCEFESPTRAESVVKITSFFKQTLR